jgi:hypothetical protein
LATQLWRGHAMAAWLTVVDAWMGPVFVSLSGDELRATSNPDIPCVGQAICCKVMHCLLLQGVSMGCSPGSCKTTGVMDVHHQEAMRLCTTGPRASTSLLVCCCPLLLLTFLSPCWDGRIPCHKLMTKSQGSLHIVLPLAL